MIAEERLVKPTPERLKKGPVLRTKQQVPDSHGNIGHPFRAADWLSLMKARGQITEQQRDAANRYVEDFRRAHLDPLHAAPFERLGFSNEGIPLAALAARRRIDDVHRALGGLKSPCARGCWEVLGFGKTIAEWCRSEGGWVREATAKGIMIGAIQALAVYYGLETEPAE